MEETTNYKLKKPSENDYVEVGVLNENMDIIDEALNRSVSVFVQPEEPSVTNCIWIKPIGGASEIEDVVLNLSDNKDGTIFAEIDGNLKSIDNAVTSESELSTGKYCFDIL